ISFFRRDSHREVTAQLWPKVWQDSDARALWGLLSRLITPPGSTQVWICLAEDDVRGLAVAHPRAGKLAWDVEDLYVVDGERSAGVGLLEQLAGEAARKGARRVFLATPVDGEMARMATQAGFVNYTSESLYSIHIPGLLEANSSTTARPRLRQDTQALFHLYNAAVPCRVRSAEAMTVEEWLSLDRGGRLWAPSLGGSRQHLVWEGKEGLAGWLQLHFGAKSQHLELLVHPAHQSETGEMVRYALSQVSPKVPIYFTVRDYQAELSSRLTEIGFTRSADYLVFARQMTVRVPNRALVPARA
ncbi:MAG TPA: hypothetical protein VHS28_07570, partial [Chloroflexota bacterium]|nr:hypothetical protein [Chloroflexota bacterium]